MLVNMVFPILFSPTSLVNCNCIKRSKTDSALLKFGSTVKRKEHKTYGRFGPKEDLIGLTATKKTFSDSDSD